MDGKVISEYNLNLIQKIHMSIILVIGIGLFILIKIIDLPYDILINIFAPILLTLFVLGILMFIVSKKGLLINENGLFNAYFTLGVLILKRKVDLNNKPIVSILKLRKSQKLPSVGIVYPSGEHSFYRFYVYLLNKSHTSKMELINLKNEENAKRITDFLTENLDLKMEIYSPKFK